MSFFRSYSCLRNTSAHLWIQLCPGVASEDLLKLTFLILVISLGMLCSDVFVKCFHISRRHVAHLSAISHILIKAGWIMLVGRRLFFQCPLLPLFMTLTRKGLSPQGVPRPIPIWSWHFLARSRLRGPWLLSYLVTRFELITNPRCFTMLYYRPNPMCIEAIWLN